MREMRQAMEFPNKVGIYLELKSIQFQEEQTGHDLIKLVWASLEANGLSTVADCEDEIPIIIETISKFNTWKWQKYTGSDLPTMITAYQPDNNEDLRWNG